VNWSWIFGRIPLDFGGSGFTLQPLMAFVKYGVEWDDGISPVEIERRCIQKGGQWKWDNGEVAGLGLFQHFKNMESLLWPEDYHNRWTDWMLNLLLTERIVVFGGSKDSGKTRRVSKWALMDYWCFPQTTLFIMTSTTNRGLELRVWGDIKSLFDRAKKRFDFLEGNAVDAKHGIFTDDIRENSNIRDMRKGILGIPTMTNEGAYDGSALVEFAGIKQGRRRLIGDEVQHMSQDYLKVLYAINSGNFKGAFLGNMIADNGRALDTIAEPINGWGSEGEITKSTAWRNKYGGMTLNLVGTDSPNLDPETKDQFEGMITQDAIDRAASLPNAKESVEWWSQILGIRKSGVVSDRVMTVETVRNNGGFDDVIWNSEPSLKILGIDAGFGGDECVMTYIECGQEVAGAQVITFREQKVIPLLIESKITVEVQMALIAKQYCDSLGIPYENVYVEAGMRASLAVEFSRTLSPAVNAINFGGSPTDRPVSNDLCICDERTKENRLKKCSEHYSKFVTELAFSVKEVVLSRQARKFPLPAAEEFQKRKWKYVRDNLYELETKIEYKERNQSKSPNYSDSVMVAVEGARRLGFAIERLKDPNFVEPDQTDWLEEEIMKERKFARTQELTYD